MCIRDRAGATLVINGASSAEKLAEAVKEYAKQGIHAHAYLFDVTSQSIKAVENSTYGFYYVAFPRTVQADECAIGGCISEINIQIFKILTVAVGDFRHIQNVFHMRHFKQIEQVVEGIAFKLFY